MHRFLEPVMADYATALGEIRNGRKEGHWMWYLFPQLRGLGESTMAWHYGIEDLAEARAYLEHPVLGECLLELTRAVLELPEHNVQRIFGWPDHMKFRSCMTLFAQVSQDDVFIRALEKFFDGEEDPLTLERLRKNGEYDD